MTTARAIYVPKGLPLQTRADLREMGMGEWEDRTWAGIDRTDHQQMALFSAGSPDFHPLGGDFPEIRRRGTAAILDIAAKHPNQTVAVFSHGTLIRNTLAAFLGYGYTSEEMHKMGHSDNTAVTLLEITDGKVNIVYMNDNSHLSPAISTLAQSSTGGRRTTRRPTSTSGLPLRPHPGGRPHLLPNLPGGGLSKPSRPPGPV